MRLSRFVQFQPCVFWIFACLSVRHYALPLYIYDASTMALCGLCHLMPHLWWFVSRGDSSLLFPPLRVLVMITVIFGLLSVCPSPFAFMLQCRGQFIRIPNEVTVPALFLLGVIPATFFLLYGCAYISDVRMRHPPLITKGMSPSRYVLHHCCLWQYRACWHTPQS